MANHGSSGHVFYTAEAGARNSYYGIYEYPTVYVDGVRKTWGWTTASLVADVNARLAVASPLDITINSFTSTQSSISVRNVTGSSFTGKIYCVIIENGLQSSGTWDFVTRDYINTNGGNGEALTLAAGASTTLTPTYTLGTGWVTSKLKLAVFVQESSKNVVQAQQADFGAVSQTITVTAPNGGETLAVGSTKQITWTTVGITSGNVTLDYTTNNGTSWTTIGSPAYNASPYTWTVPNTPSTNCKVRATQGTVTDSSDAVFTIQAASNDYDINSDGSVNFADVTLLSNMLAGVSTPNGKEDVNKDGVFNTTDLTLELAKVAGLF